jgi:hypothetical protein
MDESKCHAFAWRLPLTLGLLTDFLLVFISGAGILTGLVGLAYGGEIAYQLTTGWVEKFGCLRRVNVTSDHGEGEHDFCHILSLTESVEYKRHQERQQTVNTSEEGSNEQEGDGDDDKSDEQENQKEEISTFMINDATEHYLFIRQVLLMADRIWSPVITGFIVYAVYIAFQYGLYAITILKNPHSTMFIRVLIFSGTRFFVLVIYPIISIAHANSYIYKLKSIFQASSANDYETIGFRDRWITLLEECPPVWTFYGIWITWDRVFGILSTGAAGLVAYVISELLFLHAKRTMPQVNFHRPPLWFR